MNPRTEKIYAELDRKRMLLNSHQQELQDFLGGVMFDKRGALTSCTWLTSKGILHPDQYSPPETMRLDHILAELQDYWERATPSGLRGDDLRALKIAKLLIDFYQEKYVPETWLKKAWQVLRAARGNLPEYVWPQSPMKPPRLVYPRYRNGWEKLPEPQEETFIPEGFTGLAP